RWVTQQSRNLVMTLAEQPHDVAGREHRRPNESGAADFYLLKIEGIRIGNSPAAPLLTLIVGPSEETREVGEVKKERNERSSLRRRFWEGLLERSKAKTTLQTSVSPTEAGWLGARTGRRGLSWVYTVQQHAASAELYIDRGRGADGENEQLFQALHAHRAEVEASFGGPITWASLEGKRACRIIARLSSGGYRDEE